MAKVQFKDTRKSFGAVDVINGVDLTIESGEFVVFVGPSGSGKSTLLRMVAGLEEVTSGQIDIDGENMTFAEPSERGIAMVFQSYALYPHKTVYENIAFNLRLRRLPRSDIDQRVRAAAEILQLTEFLDRKPSQLSGGQRQRVAIGRAIVREPKVFLFDEPLSNLDAALRVEMRLQIEKLHREMQSTMIYVTHDQVEAMTLADKIVAFEAGKIQQVGTPLELYSKPSNLFVAGFIGSPRMNFIQVKVGSDFKASGNDALIADIDLSAYAVKAHDTVTIGVRPEHLTVVDVAQSDIAGEIVSFEQLGNISYAHAEASNQVLIAQQPPSAALSRGDRIGFRIDLSALHVFDVNGNAIQQKQDSN